MTFRALLPALLVLAGCASEPAPVGESKVVTAPAKAAANAGDARTVPAFHVVERGDTLFSIAWRHGLDYREVARLNGIGEPWVIRLGQRLRLRGESVRASPAAGKAATAVAATSKPAAGGKKPVAGNGASLAAGKPSATPDVAPKPAAPAAVATAPPAMAAAPGGWSWPSTGRLLGTFNPGGAGPRGISLEGSSGDPVRAARDGRVVYTGSTLVGYGQLVIVKHDDVYLSAYAHNSRLLVKEGDRVRTGDVIAEMGSTGADRVKLHFEIRRNGEPVDPQSLLPRR